MTEFLRADICVIGAGSAGLSVAAGASQLGARTVLIESHKMGGDCLNFGCVPSKALLAAAHAAQSARQAGGFGVKLPPPMIDFAAVNAHVQGVIAGIAPHDSQERFEGLGATVIRAAAAFTGPKEVAAGDYRIRARRFVIATGSTPFVPPLPGLDKLPYFTNETIFELTKQPRHLLVIGGGPIGCELAQAFRRLGAEVTVVEMARLLPKDDPDAAALVRDRLKAEGVRLLEDTKVMHAVGAEGAITLALDGKNGPQIVTGSHLLIAAGRRANFAGAGAGESGNRFDAPGHHCRCRPAHQQSPRFRHRRCHRRAAIHPRRGISRCYRHPPRLVPPAGEDETRSHPLGYLHRPGTGPGRRDRSIGAAERPRHCRHHQPLRPQRPCPD